MRTIYHQLNDGDIFTAPDETTYFVRAKTQGILYCQDVTNTNTDPVAGSNENIVEFNPNSPELVPEVDRALDLATKLMTICPQCVAAGVTLQEPAEACDACLANYQLINWFKTALS